MLRMQFVETVDRASNFYTPEKLGRTRRLTPEGYLVCEGVPIARTGTQFYHEKEINRGGEIVVKGDADGVVRVQRTAEEVFRREAVSSFEGKPITIEHPPEFVTPANRKSYEVGHVQNCRRGTDGEEDLLLADLVVKDPHAIVLVNQQLPQLSTGYDANYVQDRPGHAVQTRIIANHVALVQRGRAGSRVAIRDHQSTQESFMQNTDSVLKAIFLGKRVALGTVYEGGLKARIDNLTDKLRELSTPFTAPNILGAEPADMVIDLGQVSAGLDALDAAVADAIKLKADLAAGQAGKLRSELVSNVGITEPLQLSDLIKRMNFDGAQLRANDTQMTDQRR